MDRVTAFDLSDNFICRLARLIEDEYLAEGADISRLAFVFGGKRPALFLKKELSRRIKKPFLAPRFFSIDEFVEYALAKSVRFNRISDLDACFTVYELAKDIAPDILRGREKFSQFLPWAREVLSFIEQLDLEDINIRSLKDVQLKAEIGYDVPENINALLGGIISLRGAYHLALEGKAALSRGLLYLTASRRIADADFGEFEQIFFCGFFYLHKTERCLIKTLLQAEKARLVFQGDPDDWPVLKRLSEELSVPIAPEHKKSPGYSLSVQAGFDVHSQACLIREIIRKIDKPDRTVVVLPQPENIIPLLSEISCYADDFNVSMGYPLKRSSLYSLFECVFKAQSTRKPDQYYAKDYLEVLSHPLVKNLRFFPDPSLTRVLAHKVEEVLLGTEKTPLGGSLFFKLSDMLDLRDLYDLSLKTMKSMGMGITWEELRQALAALHGLFFTSWETVDNFCDFSLALERVLDALVDKSPLGSYPLNLKMAEAVYSIIEELKSSSFNREEFSKEDIFRIFRNRMGSEMVSFSGSPLKGLQILGLFETRSLTFENVVVMDTNESVLPNLKIYEPLIPREVMISLGLNRLEKEEEIQRYQFMRLLSGAKEVRLVYQQSDEREKSRFIEELIWQRQKREKRLDVLPALRAGFRVGVLPKKLRIQKDAKMLKFLREREYSASSMNTYLHCPLRFYYQYVLGLKEKDDLLDEPEGADIGTFIHELLFQAFSRFVGKAPRINERFRKDFLRLMDEKFSEEFQRKMKSDSFLVREILSFRLGRFLDNEAGRDVDEILCLEKVFRSRIRVNGAEIRFKAIVDRIDLLSDATVLVVDYKTGSQDIMPQAAERVESAGFARQALKNTLKSFQLPLYLYMIDSEEKYAGRKTDACLYTIKDLDKDFGLNRLLNKQERLAEKPDIMNTYLKALDSQVAEILNPDSPFMADEGDKRQCLNCPFFYLCR